MSGLMEKIEHAMHHGKKLNESAATSKDDVPKFGSGHIEKASGGYYDAGADLHSAPVHEPNAKPGVATYEGTNKGKTDKERSETSDETEGGRSREERGGDRTGVRGGPAMPSSKESEGTGYSSSGHSMSGGHASSSEGFSGGQSMAPPSGVGMPSTTSMTSSSSSACSGYEAGSSAPVGQVLPGPANVSEIVQEVEAMEGGSFGGVGGAGGRGTGL